eukprot:TRINITY_DN1711_c0_g1_i1.p1 TRINITY_DN1711_c0_g1~~TRINITY_DN1711_c0_g1_i1.p1  ORF type:complete len:144 (+),score=31.71 TRINITY_DN1711_c0_g1_i1:56-487(+)
MENPNLEKMIEAIDSNDINTIKNIMEIENYDINEPYEELDVEFNYTPLTFAIEKNNIEAMKILLTHQNIDINKEKSAYRKCEDRIYTPLAFAIERKNIDAMKILLTCQNIDVNKENSYLDGRVKIWDDRTPAVCIYNQYSNPN